MAFTLIDGSFGTDHNNHRLIRSGHVAVPRIGQPARPMVMQVEINNAALLKNSSARVRILNDHYEWTVLLDVPVSDWHRSVNPSAADNQIEAAMNHLADDLVSRAVNLLGC